MWTLSSLSLVSVVVTDSSGGKVGLGFKMGGGNPPKPPLLGMLKPSPWDSSSTTMKISALAGIWDTLSIPITAKVNLSPGLKSFFKDLDNLTMPSFPLF